MTNFGPRLVVGALAGTRVAIGVAFAVAPRRLGARSGGSADILMTRSFAVREVILGIGGLVAVTRGQQRQSAVRMWAGLGALTDAGDLAASLADARRRSRSPRVPTVLATLGLLAEGWAFTASSSLATEGPPEAEGQRRADPRVSARS